MSDPIRRREDEDVERELSVDHSQDEPPGGAEGGDESRSADAIVDLPGEPGPLGDTDQHSDPDNLPPHREEHNQDRS
jgi:hypothetical protein